MPLNKETKPKHSMDDSWEIFFIIIIKKKKKKHKKM